MGWIQIPVGTSFKFSFDHHHILLQYLYLGMLVQINLQQRTMYQLVLILLVIDRSLWFALAHNTHVRSIFPPIAISSTCNKRLSFRSGLENGLERNSSDRWYQVKRGHGLLPNCIINFILQRGLNPRHSREKAHWSKLGLGFEELSWGQSRG